MKRLLLDTLLLSTLGTGLAAAASYDLVIHGGRVMDPETGVDAVLNVGITGDRIRCADSLPRGH